MDERKLPGLVEKVLQVLPLDCRSSTINALDDLSGRGKGSYFRDVQNLLDAESNRYYIVIEENGVSAYPI